MTEAVDYGAQIVAMATRFLGQHEQPMGSNRGPLPDRCAKFVGMAPGNPWCAAFASLMVALCGHEHGPHTGSTGGIAEWAKQGHGGIVKSPKPGYLGLLRDSKSPTGYEHTVIVKAVKGPLVLTIEGNYGDAVRAGVRRASTLDYVCPWS